MPTISICLCDDNGPSGWLDTDKSRDDYQGSRVTDVFKRIAENLENALVFVCKDLDSFRRICNDSMGFSLLCTDNVGAWQSDRPAVDFLEEYSAFISESKIGVIVVSRSDGAGGDHDKLRTAIGDMFLGWISTARTESDEAADAIKGVVAEIVNCPTSRPVLAPFRKDVIDHLSSIKHRITGIMLSLDVNMQLAAEQVSIDTTLLQATLNRISGRGPSSILDRLHQVQKLVDSRVVVPVTSLSSVCTEGSVFETIRPMLGEAHPRLRELLEHVGLRANPAGPESPPTLISDSEIVRYLRELEHLLAGGDLDALVGKGTKWFEWFHSEWFTNLESLLEALRQAIAMR